MLGASEAPPFGAPVFVVIPPADPLGRVAAALDERNVDLREEPPHRHVDVQPRSFQRDAEPQFAARTRGLPYDAPLQRHPGGLAELHPEKPQGIVPVCLHVSVLIR